MPDPTPPLSRDEIESVLADALAEAEADADADGMPGALLLAEAWAALALLWDDALRPLLDNSVLLAYVEDVADPDGDGRVERETLAAFAGAVSAAVASALTVTFLATALAPFVARVSRAYREARGFTAALPAVAAWTATGAGTPESPGVRVEAVLGGPDRAALAWLRQYAGFWVREAHGRRVEPALRAATERVLSGRMSLDDAAEELSAALRGVHRSGLSYWRLVASASVSRAQSLGRLAAFEAAGVPGGYVSIVRDDRTSEVSTFMRGRFVPLETMRQVRTRLLAGTNPEEWKRASPWWFDKDVAPGGALRRMVEANGGEVPPEAGMIPWHPHDRDVLLIRPPSE